MGGRQQGSKDGRLCTARGSRSAQQHRWGCTTAEADDALMQPQDTATLSVANGCICGRHAALMPITAHCRQQGARSTVGAMDQGSGQHPVQVKRDAPGF